MTGSIKKIIAEKGFGFITPEGSTTDLFFHKSSLTGVSFEELREGDKVSFEEEDSEKGKNAVGVTRA